MQASRQEDLQYSPNSGMLLGLNIPVCGTYFSCGGVAERLKAVLSKSIVRVRPHRGFESRLLRQCEIPFTKIQ